MVKIFVTDWFSRGRNFFPTSVADLRPLLGLAAGNPITDTGVESVQPVDQILVGDSTRLGLRFVGLFVDALDQVVELVHQLVVVDGRVERSNHGPRNHIALEIFIKIVALWGPNKVETSL